jgi:hypothetical protein
LRLEPKPHRAAANKAILYPPDPPNGTRHCKFSEEIGACRRVRQKARDTMLPLSAGEAMRFRLTTSGWAKYHPYWRLARLAGC